MKIGLAGAIGLLALCASATSCANDTGNPKLPAGGGSMFGVGGVSGPVRPPVGATGGFSGGSTAGASAPPMRPPPNAMTCRVITQDSSAGLISDDCTACTCDTNPTATSACTSDCWKLLICVSQHCDPTDTNCVVANCADEVGGAANLAAVGALARSTPFTQCATKCVPRTEHQYDDGGDF